MVLLEHLTPEQRRLLLLRRRLARLRRLRQAGLLGGDSSLELADAPKDPGFGKIEVAGEVFDRSARYVEAGGEIFDQRPGPAVKKPDAPDTPDAPGSDLPGYGVQEQVTRIERPAVEGYTQLGDPTTPRGQPVDAAQMAALSRLQRINQLPTIVSGGTVLRASADAPKEHDLKVLTDDDGKEWLVPRAVAEDFEFQVGRHAFYTEQGYDLPSPKLPKDVGVDVSGMSAADKAALVKVYHESSTAADEKRATLDTIGRKLDIANYGGGHRDPAQVAAVKSTLTPAQLALFDEAMEEHEEKVGHRKSVPHFLDRASDFLGPVAFGKAIYSARQPDSPGGIYNTPGEDLRTGIEAGGFLVDITGASALVEAPVMGALRNVTRVAAPQKLGGGLLPGAFDKFQTTRVPLKANDFAAQEFNLSRSLAKGESAAVDVGGQLYKVDPSPASRMMAELNPSQQIWYHSGDVANLNPGGRVQPWDRSGKGQMTESAEDRIFGGSDVYNRFADFSAGGTQHSQPGLVAVAVPSAEQMVVVPSRIKGPAFQNVMQVPRERIGLLGHTVDPEPGELRKLIEGGFSEKKATALASKPEIEGAVDVPGKTWHAAKESEGTFPSAHGASEFVGVIPELEAGPYAGSGLTTRLYVPKGFKTPTYRERLALNLEVVKKRAAEIAEDPLLAIRKREGDFGLRQVDDVSDVRIPDSGGDAAALTPAAEDARPTLVSKEYPIDPADERLIRLSRTSTARLKREFPDDPLAKEILQQRAEFDARRLGQLGDDAGDVGDDLARRGSDDLDDARPGTPDEFDAGRLGDDLDDARPGTGVPDEFDAGRLGDDLDDARPGTGVPDEFD